MFYFLILLESLLALCAHLKSGDSTLTIDPTVNFLKALWAEETLPVFRYF